MTDERLKIFSEHRRSKPLEELRRKAKKARRGALWTVEEIDLARVEAKRQFEDLFDELWVDPYDEQGIIV